MYFIVVKYQVKPEFSEVFLERTAEFTAATRAERGNLWFDWYTSAENPHEFVLIEAFADEDGEHIYTWTDNGRVVTGS